MKPSCSTCLYYRPLTAKCHNPDSNFYEDCLLPKSHCRKWEDAAEFSDNDGKRFKTQRE